MAREKKRRLKGRLEGATLENIYEKLNDKPQ